MDDWNAQWFLLKKRFISYKLNIYIIIEKSPIMKTCLYIDWQHRFLFNWYIYLFTNLSETGIFFNGSTSTIWIFLVLVYRCSCFQYYFNLYTAGRFNLSEPSMFIFGYSKFSKIIRYVDVAATIWNIYIYCLIVILPNDFISIEVSSSQ